MSHNSPFGHIEPKTTDTEKMKYDTEFSDAMRHLVWGFIVWFLATCAMVALVEAANRYDKEQREEAAR